MRITLNGQVVSDGEQWLYDYFDVPAFSPGKVRQALAENPAGEALVLEINSPGGNVFDGFEMYTLLRGAECETVAEVQSLAASAASTVISGCKRVLMSPVAQVMLHQPTIATWGNADDHECSLRMLQSIQRSILNGYAARCGGKTTRQHLEELVNAETWLTAQEAIELGLADEILGEGEAAAAGVAVVNAAPGKLTDPKALLARYEAAVRNGAAPLEGHPVAVNVPPAGKSPAEDKAAWQRKARLAIENSRF